MSTSKLPPVIEAKARRGAGRYGVGDGLYLYVRDNGARGWVFRYRDRITGKLRDKGLGTFPDVTLAMARADATEQRRSLQAGINPIDAAREARSAERLEHSRQKTFGYCCTEYIATRAVGWRNAKHRAQWTSTLHTHAADLLPLPVQDIDTARVHAALKAIWTTTTETATRVRQRIEAVLDWATVHGYRIGDNPARWRGHLDKLLDKPRKVKKPKQHAALPYDQVPAFIATLAAKDTVASKALRLQILTAARPSEAIAARWEEIDLTGKVWTVPAARMKANRAHRVPLSPEVIKLLDAIKGERKGFVFPGKPDRPITIAATLRVVQDIHPGLTAHGFRSSFRDWAAEQTAYPREVAERALAHSNKDKTEAAYLRSDLLQRRAPLMADWAQFCGRTSASSTKVTPIRRAGT